MYRDMDLEWHTLQALELRDKNKMLTNVETFEPNDLVYLLALYSSSLQSKVQKFRQDYIGPLRAKEVMPDGLPDKYEQLQTQIGLPNDACANSQRSSTAQL